MSWQEYLDKFVDSVRQMYEQELLKLGLSPKVLEDMTDSLITRYTFLKPCQIYVFQLPLIHQVAWFVTFDHDKPDKFFEVVEELKVSLKEFLESSAEYTRFLGALESKREIIDVKDELFLEFQVTFSIPCLWLFNYGGPKERIPPERLTFRLWSTKMAIVYRYLQWHRITKSAEEILDKARVIRKARPSRMLLKAEKEIQKSLGNLKKIDEHEQRLMTMEGQIKDFRALVGYSKEFQYFKAFTADIGYLKKTHMNKEVLQSEIKRLDQRIEDLKAIKLWSKRTLLEIALAIMTVIAALYGTGVIKF